MKQLHIVTFIFTQQSGCHVEGTVGLHKHDDEKHFVKVQNLICEILLVAFLQQPVANIREVIRIFIVIDLRTEISVSIEKTDKNGNVTPPTAATSSLVT